MEKSHCIHLLFQTLLCEHETTFLKEQPVSYNTTLLQYEAYSAGCLTMTQKESMKQKKRKGRKENEKNANFFCTYIQYEIEQ